MAERSFRQRKQLARARSIARAQANLRACRGTLVAPEETRKNHANLALAVSLSVATVCHVGVACAAFSSRPATLAVPARERVQVKLVEAPPTPKPEIETEPAEAPPAPRPRVRKAAPKAPPAPAPRPAEPLPEPAAIVGVDLESTSTHGAGPAFAVGNTLAGSTETVAAAPEPAPAVAPALQPLAASRNRRAMPRAAAGVQVGAAKRLSRVEPEYPPLLKQQGLEADVTVRVRLDESGRVASVELVLGANERAFDEAALAAARKEQFSPETHDGKPVATTLTYTYRFRITP